MLTGFQWLSLACILAVTLAGGYLPLVRRERARAARGFPMGQAFSAGVFLALSLTLMLPGGLKLLGKATGGWNFPLGALIAGAAFLLLLSLEHIVGHLRGEAGQDQAALSPPAIPIIMTIMIALPSFLLGTALGVSESNQAVMIAVAIMIHKGSAAFALGLKMVRSTMAPAAVWLLFALFALATPAGILVGQDFHRLLAGQALWIIKGAILSLASGVFLYMSTLHDLKNTPLIVDCRTLRGFAWTSAGFILTVIVRLLIGESQHF